jgi:hypothetical protein
MSDWWCGVGARQQASLPDFVGVYLSTSGS